MRNHRVVTGPGRDDGGRQEDAALASAVAGGSREALGTLFRRYGDELVRLAYRITGTCPDAEDTVQDVFVGLPRALAKYEEQGRFISWLRQLTARTALSRVRSRGRRATEPLDANEPAPGASADPVDRIAMARALADLPEQQRTVFLLKEVEGYDHAEIGALLSISEGASRVRLHRAWRFLEDRMGEGPTGRPPRAGGR